MADLEFITTDAQTIYTAFMQKLMDSVNEALYPGDERRIFGEALAAVLVALYNDFNDKAKQRLLRYASGPVLDAIGERYGVYRAEPSSASAVFRFSATAAQPGNIIIPEGTRITTDGSVYFATERVAVLQAGSAYTDVPGICTEGGAAYNGFNAGSIGTLVDLIPYITAVNLTVSSGGDDGEPYPETDGGAGDDKYRERIRLSPAKQSTAGPESAYRYFALSADPDIIDVAIDVPEAGRVNIYPLMKNGELPDEDTLSKVQNILADDVRPMTDLVQALSPVQVEYDIEIKYYCAAGTEAATVDTIENAAGAIERYNTWQTAALNRDINPDQLRRFILAPDWKEGLTGAVRVEVVSPVFQSLGKHEVAKFSGKAVISHEVIGWEGIK